MRTVAIALIVALAALWAPALAEEAAVEAQAVDSAVMPGEPLLPAQDETVDAPAAPTEAPAEGGSEELQPDADAVQAPPVGDPRVPDWTGDTQREGGTVADVPSVILAQQKPALPLEGIKIGIDPGHQAKGNNEKETVAPNSSKTKPKVSSGTSGVSTHIAEYVTVLEIALKLRDSLEAQGAEVYMTRDTHDVNISNQERAKMMNEVGVDLVLRIHCDGAENRSKHGIALYCSKSNSIAAESYRAAEAILPAVCAATGAKANGIVSNDNYTGQNWSTVPCIMVECGFMSNPDEDVLLNDESYQQKLADGLTLGIMDYIAERDGR